MRVCVHVVTHIPILFSLSHSMRLAPHHWDPRCSREPTGATARKDSPRVCVHVCVRHSLSLCICTPRRSVKKKKKKVGYCLFFCFFVASVPPASALLPLAPPSLRFLATAA